MLPSSIVFLRCQASSINTEIFQFYPSGVEVPSKDSLPKKRPIYEDKKKKKPPQQMENKGLHTKPVI